jgi:hypothetical protein
MNIKKILSDWAESTFPPSQSAYQADIQELPEAPPLLFTGSSEAGFCVTIQPVSTFLLSTSAFSSPATVAAPQLGFWIPAYGAPGTQAVLHDGDAEIETSPVNWMELKGCYRLTEENFHLTGQEALEANLRTHFHSFRQKHVFAPALEEWLDGKGLEYSIYHPDIIGGEAMEAGIENWFLVCIETEDSDTAPILLGVSGRGQAATLYYSDNELHEGGTVEYIDIEEQTAAIQTPADLHAWLDATVSPRLLRAAA